MFMYVRCLNCDTSEFINKEATIKIREDGQLDLSEVWCVRCLNFDMTPDLGIVDYDY